MKLINKINISYLVYSAIIMVLLGIGIHFSMRYIINEETDEKLEYTSIIVAEQIKKTGEFPSLEPYISVNAIGFNEDTAYFSDKAFLDEDQESEIFRQLTVIMNIDNDTYQIIIRESVVESDDLLEAVSVLILVSLSLLLILLYFLNRKVSKRVWSVFYVNLEKLKQFSLTELMPFEPEQSDILEFRELNEVIKTLTEKVIKDYEILKRFSEDASHELQTPLAVIRSKIESLFEGNDLNQSQREKIQSIYNSVNKLSRINKGLLLLAKIENKQFSHFELLNINDLIEEKADYFKELAEIKGLKLNYNCLSNWSYNTNRNLFDILLNNLIGNAITHSDHGGNINITLERKKLLITNPGVKPIENIDKMFERFYKGPDSGSVGLGLSILRQICIALNLMIEYSFEKGMHIFTIKEKL